MTHARLPRFHPVACALLACLPAAPLFAANDYQVDLVIDPAKGTLHGTEKVTYRNETEAPVDTVFLEAPALRGASGAGGAERWKIVSFTDAKGGRFSPDWKAEDEAYVVRLAAPVAPGFKTVFTVEYERPIDASESAAGYLDLNDRGASSWYPKFRAYRAGSLGSDDFKDLSVSVSAPPGWVVAGSGAAAPGKGGAARATLAVKGTRNFALAAGEKLKLLRGSAGTVPILVYSLEGQDAWARQALAETTEAIAFYQGFLGAYPPAQVSVLPAAPELTRGESSSQVIYAPAGSAALRESIALQAARLVWGWSVGDPSDATPFVANGMAIWCQQNYLAKKNQTDLHTQYLRSGINDTYLAGVLRGLDTTLMRSRADRAKIEWDFERIVAQAKSGAVMHMLGGILGEDKLQEVSRGLLKGGKHFVTDRDFQRAAQAATSARLDGFFDQWLRTRNHLDYYMSRVRSAKAAGGYEARADVYKTGSAAMPVEVVATDRTGEKVRAIFPADRDSGEIVIPLKAPLASMALDPLQRLPLIARVGPAGRADLAEALMVEGKLLRADEQIDQALGDEPDHPRAWFLKGRILKERGDWSGALAAWDKVIRLTIPPDDPAKIWSQLWTARLYDLQEKRSEATALYTAVSGLPDARGSKSAAEAGLKAPFTDSWPPLAP